MPVDSSLVLRSAYLDGECLATLVPASPSFVYSGRTIAPERHYVLSRFAYVHPGPSEMILESPRAHARITLHGWRPGALVHALAEPQRAGDLAGLIPSLTTDAAAAVMTLLLNAGMLEEANEHGSTGEDETPALQSWEFHDLLFHARSRGGRHDARIGATYRLLGRLDPAPALKPARSGESFPLDRPDLDRLEREDPPFARVQEARRSIRDYAQRPISAHQLGEFLYRVGRVTDYRTNETHTPQGSITTEHAPRPYPAGGALYELELYVAINACEGLAAGLYYHDPDGHRLIRLSSRTVEVEQLLADAGRATTIPAESIQVLIIIAARFRRIAWKYASIAYALTLKHVGVLTQTMYLVATAMDLAPCSAGVGDSDLFARAAGTDYYDETSVGEFLLGEQAEMKRPEVELLLRCARTRIDPESAGRIRDLAGTELDWTVVIRRAFQHGVMPLVARNLQSTCPDVVPPGVLSRLQGDFATNAARNLFLISELLNILGLLAERGIPAIPLKGPVLAGSVYGSASLRQSNDLDILVHRKDLVRARDLLILEAPAPRYHPKEDDRPDPLPHELGYHAELMRDDGRLVVELHWDLMDPRFCMHLDPEPFWSRLEPVTMAGTTVSRFGSEDLLLYLCAHATKHQWERLSLICDVAELIRHAPGLDWGVLLRRAHASGTQRILFVGLLLANRLLDAPLPEAIVRRIGRDAVAGSLAREVHNRLDRDDPALPEWDEARERFFLAVRERLSDRIRSCVRLGRIPAGVDRAVLPPPARAAMMLLGKLKPNHADHDMIRLPSSLEFLYYLLRPLRLICWGRDRTAQGSALRSLRKKGETSPGQLR